jgi:phospholipase C
VPLGSRVYLGCLVLSGSIFLVGCGGTGNGSTASPSTFQLTVSQTGSGTGTITSSPAGINCGQTCSATFSSGTTVTLTATPNTGFAFGGWSGACSGTSTCAVALTASTTVSAVFNLALRLTVSEAGFGSGVVTSNPPGINCAPTCTATFTTGTTVTLTATPNSGFQFAGWSGACTGTGTCSVPVNGAASVTATFGGSLQSINHIIFMAQENRGFDHHFGALRQYWAQNGFEDKQFDGLAQFNPTSGIPPLQGPPPTSPGCDPAFPFDPVSPTVQDCVTDSSSPQIASFHLSSMCVENPSPSWSESHNDVNHEDPTSPTPPAGGPDGYVWSAAHDARHQNPPFNDTDGLRAMGHYDGGDLNYYYFMASNFATSDSWFSPVMTRTQPNRMYMLAGTSAGHTRPLPAGSLQLQNKTIFEALQNAGISWKVYVSDPNPTLIQGSAMAMFAFSNQFPQNFVPASQFMADAANGTLPQVAMIEPGYSSGRDEHPFETVNSPGGSVQVGASYVSGFINSLMQSQSWRDSAFILTWDEAGGFYDHVPPHPTVTPDGILPNDLTSSDVCSQVTGPTCDFVYTGFRVPLIVVSPFVNKHFVSHTPADHTAILKLIETRFGLASLTNRDAAQMDMTEFFDFVNAPWSTPPPPSQIPTQITSGPCVDQLP